MIDIVVTRGSGLREGDPFVSPLLCDPVIAEFKGVALLDEFSVMHSSLVVEVPYHAGLRNGQMTTMHEGVNGLVWNGKIIGISHKVRDGTFVTEVTIDKVDAP